LGEHDASRVKIALIVVAALMVDESVMEIERQRYRFKTKRVWFSPPFDVTGYHLVVFHAAKPKLDLDGFQREAEPTLVIDLNQELENDME